MSELVILPAVRAIRSEQGGFVLTQKYLEGASAFARFWPGTVTSLVEVTSDKSTDFDHIEVFPDALDTGLEERPATATALMQRLQKASVVLGFLSRRDAPLAALCRKAGVPLAYVIEYAPETEMQIIRAQTRNPLRIAHGLFWLFRTDRIRRKAARLSDGLQCSGTPTYEYYRDIQPNRLLFFDNRIEGDGVITDARLDEKLDGLTAGRPLRLIFGGRFVAMKGVMALPEVARHLTAAGVDFTLDIYGDGPLRPALLARIEALGLGDIVRVQAPVDFRSGWVPTLVEQADLFVCCHPQGDPSSTYPEVMSCGVPIVGYANSAFRGIVAHSGCGWLTPVGEPQALAAQIATLASQRPALAEAARKGREFAKAHVFEATFKARADQLIELMNA